MVKNTDFVVFFVALHKAVDKYSNTYYNYVRNTGKGVKTLVRCFFR